MRKKSLVYLLPVLLNFILPLDGFAEKPIPLPTGPILLDHGQADSKSKTQNQEEKEAASGGGVGLDKATH